MSDEKLPIGTRIRFLKELYQGPTGDTPAFVFAKPGTFGTVVGHDCKEGHRVLWEKWPSAAFGAVLGTEFVKAE